MCSNESMRFSQSHKSPSPLIFLIGLFRMTIGGLPAATDASSRGETDEAILQRVQGEVEKIRTAVDMLQKKGVLFDDESPQGHVPKPGGDGRYRMACVDLILVTYRMAGYDFCQAMNRGSAIQRPAPEFGSYDQPGGHARLLANLLPFLKRSKLFRVEHLEERRPTRKEWPKEHPMCVGDMIFFDYSCNSDRHSGIVMSVDKTTGAPDEIAHVSYYNDNQGLEISSLEKVFQVGCRGIQAYGRPAHWDEEPARSWLDSLAMEPKPVDPQESRRTMSPNQQQILSLIDRFQEPHSDPEHTSRHEDGSRHGADSAPEDLRPRSGRTTTGWFQPRINPIFEEPPRSAPMKSPSVGDHDG